MKAIIMSHEHGGSYVMDKEGCFQFVKGFTMQPIGAEIEIKAQITPLFSYARTVALAASLIFAIALGSFAWLWNTENFSAYVDINPSIELVFNNLSRLKEVKPLNEDGAALLQGIKLPRTPGDAVVALIKEAEQQGYLQTQGDLPPVFIMIAARGNKNPEKYLTSICDALEKNELQDLADVDSCNEDYLDRALELGVSPGKLKLAELLNDYDQSLSLSDLLHMSVNDLQAALTEVKEQLIASADTKNPRSVSPETFALPDPNGFFDETDDDPEDVDATGRLGGDPIIAGTDSDLNANPPDIDDPDAQEDTVNATETPVLQEEGRGGNTDTPVSQQEGGATGNPEPDNTSGAGTNTGNKSGGGGSITPPPDPDDDKPPPKHTVTYDLGQENKTSASYEHGATIEETIPTKVGYIFEGWFTAAEGGEKWNFATPLTSDLTLYAHWIPDLADVRVSISFPGFTDVVVSYRNNVSAWVEVDVYTDACVFTIPPEQRPSPGDAAIRVAKGIMSHTFYPGSLDNPLTLVVPQKTITVTGVPADCSLGLTLPGQTELIDQLTPPLVSKENIFKVFNNDSSYEVLLTKSGFSTIRVPVPAAQTVDFASYFYTIFVPADISNLSIQSDGEIVSNASTGHPITLLKDPANPKAATMTFTYGGTVYENKPFQLDGSNPFMPSVSVSAVVDKIDNNYNTLTITVTELYVYGYMNQTSNSFTIVNNGEGDFEVGGYLVYVKTTGNINIAECYIKYRVQ